MAKSSWKVVVTALVCAGSVTAAADTKPQRQDTAARTQAFVLAPHRAVYEFKLGTVRSQKSLSALTGRMVYEFTGSPCEGYSQSMRLVTRTTAASGAVTVSDQRSTSWEDDTGMRYRFQTSQYRNQKLVEQTAGTATRGEGAEDIRVELTHPDKRRAAVGSGAMFPVQHSIKLLDAARRGRTGLTTDFFDGSEGGEKTYVLSAQIGRPVAAGFNRSLPRVGQVEKLDNMAAWPIMLSYYEQGGEAKDALPVWELGYVFYANGVSRRLVIDNGEYTMLGEITDLQMIDQPVCRK
jgi:hypothetical protein